MLDASHDAVELSQSILLIQSSAVCAVCSFKIRAVQVDILLYFGCGKFLESIV